MPTPNFLGGAQPLRQPDPNGPRRALSEYIRELIRLSPEDYRGVAIPLISTLSSSTTSNTQTYRVPATHNLVIKEIVGHLALVGYSSEVLDASAGANGYGNFSTNANVQGRALMHAMNTRIALSNSDRSQNLFENNSMNLSTFTPFLGGRALEFGEVPHIIPAGETVSMTASLILTTAAVVGGSTESGCVLIGHLVRVAAS